MKEVASSLTQLGSILKDHPAFLGILKALLLRSRGTIEVATSSCGRIECCYTNLRMGIIGCSLLEGSCFLEDHMALFCLLDGLLLRSRGTVEVATSSCGAVYLNGNLGVKESNSQFLELLGIFQNTETLEEIFVLLLVIRTGIAVLGLTVCDRTLKLKPNMWGLGLVETLTNCQSSFTSLLLYIILNGFDLRSRGV